MKPSKRVQKVVILVATLLLLGGLSVAQEPNAKDWGTVADGLQMRISLDQAATRQFEIPKFRVELRNVGEKDLLLNLGIIIRNGGQQYPTAISLILADPQRPFQLIELKRSLPVDGVGRETLYLPLSIGATFSFRVDLDDYWAVNSKEFDSKLKPGTYWLAAHLNGFIRTPDFVFSFGPEPVFVNQIVTLSRSFGSSSFNGYRVSPPPRSNVLRFEIPSR